jgi:hypothetical protein
MVSITFCEYGSIDTSMLDTRYNVSTHDISTAVLANSDPRSVDTILLSIMIAVHDLKRTQL